MSRLVVVKVGGSLYDLPDLGPRLRRFLEGLDADRILIVPGGGIAADAIRAYDRAHRLGDEAAHWLALRMLTVNACFLSRLLPEYEIAPNGDRPRVLLDAHAFALADEKRPDPLPHVWEATSDSVAAQAAWRNAAVELVLLKSRPWDGADWKAAAAAGIVDPIFPHIAQRLNATTRIVPLRQVQSAPPPHRSKQEP